MINLDFMTLKLFFEENIDFIIGARLQKIQQPTRRDFVFSLRNNGEARKLYININPQFYHISFMNSENEKRRNIIMPQKPPMFCMLLRKYLEGCRISDAQVVKDERIIEFYFETLDEFSVKRSLCLCVELMGKHSNVILYDRITSVITGCAHNVGAEKSRYRELQGGLKYTYPPAHTINKEIPCLFKIAGGDNVNKAIDDYFSNIQEKVNLMNERARLIAVIQPKIRKVKNSTDKITALLKKRDNTEKYKLYGELLTANLYQKKDYSKSITLFDYINNQEIEIELDETKTLNENAQRYFKLYTKSKTTKEKSEELLSRLKIEHEYLETVLYSINSAKSFEELEEIRPEIEPEIKTKKQKKTEIMKLEIKGFDVYIGKNNKQNDLIVSKLARGEDYWFHTHLCAGSHVLLKVNASEPDEEVLFECCKLARKYSSALQPSKVGVIYTKAKNLRKPPAAPLGYVTYKGEKEILI